MLTPTQWWLAVLPIDLRCGMDRLLVAVRAKLDRDAFDGGGFVFCNRARTRIKVLVVDATGVWLCVRRLHEGSFVWPRTDAVACVLDAEQFGWLCAGVDWQRLRAREPAQKCVMRQV
ncbi:MAG: IS66 family insertion sequence element accessory protein TnpB [Proteobacteria bacterium]|nr:IS66 family insertion sequence element accessory protein TnpB [Pseudomonadota bacterium]